MTEKITNFLNITQNYKVLLFDVVGVVHNGIEAFPHAIESINALDYNQRVIFLSNMPRPGTQTRETLKRLGITKSFDVLTSGDVTRTLLTTTYAGQRVFHWGAERNVDIDAGLDLNQVGKVELADVVLLTAFLNPGEDESPHQQIIEKIIEQGIPVLCANPDKIAMFGDQIRKCAGSFADKIIEQGGQVTLIGKPSPFIYHQIMANLSGIKPEEILMIGDTIETDIIGAKQVGMDSLLVLTGNTGNDLRAQNENLQSYLGKKSWEHNSPTYCSDDLGNR
ncbi:TIGR01459 family HAD-type hydrolase [Candidatus Finniella inopinata]|uniref:TIGR01459 family HAD-type hydrolase n=1 Tax=Candidatus Finniella inopinata TaxID=1696036 RepID=A0A4Q7DH07_9PROT|nr:TIGR01459 family HAD-type hydrolase [Candidatus Finniella inopinata]RZI45528.1 TIGR01459 family HAD-type hydrolase [Candidatus Finniella inopinata]